MNGISIKPAFRKIFVAEPTHDVRMLSKYTDTIVFLTNGNDEASTISDIVENALVDFDPRIDAIIPVGRVITTLIVGIKLGAMFCEQSFNMGVFRDGDYSFVNVAPLWRFLHDR